MVNAGCSSFYDQTNFFNTAPSHFQELIKLQSQQCLWHSLSLSLFTSRVQIPFYYSKSNLFTVAGCIKGLHCILLPHRKCPRMQNIFILWKVARHHWMWNKEYELKGWILWLSVTIIMCNSCVTDYSLAHNNSMSVIWQPRGGELSISDNLIHNLTLVRV